MNAHVWAILGIVFVWSFLGEVRYVKWLVPKPAGLTQMSGYTLIGIYLAARLLRTYESLLPKNAVIWLLCALGFGGAVSCLHFGFYNSPFQLISAVAWFLAFKGLKLNKTIGNIFCLLSPSIFSIYVIHTTQTGIHFIKYLDTYLMQKLSCGILVTFIVGFTVFGVSFALDLPRRMVLQRIKTALQNK